MSPVIPIWSLSCLGDCFAGSLAVSESSILQGLLRVHLERGSFASDMTLELIVSLNLCYGLSPASKFKHIVVS